MPPTERPRGNFYHLMARRLHGNWGYRTFCIASGVYGPLPPASKKKLLIIAKVTVLRHLFCSIATFLDVSFFASAVPDRACQIAAAYVIARWTTAPSICWAFRNVAPQVVPATIPATIVSALLYSSILIFTVARCGPHFKFPVDMLS